MPVTAKLFVHDHGQAVQLPDGFRFQGTEVLVTRHGHGVMLEAVRHPPVDLDEVWQRIDALRGGDEVFEAGAPEDPVPPIDERRFFE